MAVIDVVTSHNELEMFDLRYNILKDYVDQFIVVESKTAFNTYPKPLYFADIESKYPKVKYYLNTEEYTPEEREQAANSPNTNGHPRWIHEFLQKESITKAIAHLNDDDIVFIGDVDEIPDTRSGTISQILYGDYELLGDRVLKLKLRVYTYYLNMRSSEEFWGTIVGRYGNIKGQCLNHLRNLDPTRNMEYYGGWHFTSQGGYEAVRNKIFDQYNPEVFGDHTYMELPTRFGVSDYVGRDFKLEVDESELPKYLLDNRDKYIHMFKV